MGRTKKLFCAAASAEDDEEAVEQARQRKAAADKRKAAADDRKAAADERRRRLEREATSAEQDANKSAESEENKGPVWKKTDPLQFPAYMFTKAAFKANNPLIQVACGDSKMPAFNKFSTELRIKASVRQAAMLKCVKETCRSFSLYEDPMNEEFKSSLFRNLEQFTVPSSEALNRLESNQKLLESLTGQKRKRVDAAHLEGLSDQRDLLMEIGSLSSNEDMDEDDVEQGLIYADKKVYVRDKTKDHLADVERGDKKLVIVVEEKSKSKEGASYQGGQSALAEIATNISRKYASPVYVLSLAGKWKYAILHVRGMVNVRNGKIDRSSLTEFREQEKAMGFGNDPIPDLDLDIMLEKRTLYYQKRFSDAPMSAYPDGVYPVGKFYVSDTWRTLPQDAVGGCVNPDVHLFYEGLLRIIIGDRVINWDDEKLNRVWKVRKSMRQEDFQLKTSRV